MPDSALLERKKNHARQALVVPQPQAKIAMPASALLEKKLVSTRPWEGLEGIVYSPIMRSMGLFIFFSTPLGLKRVHFDNK